MNLFRKFLHIVSWVVYGVLLLFLFMIPGVLFFVPLMLLLSQDKNNLDVPDWYPWGNREEGCPDWWLDRDKHWIKDVFPRWWWFSVRNPVNNSRYWFKDRVPKFDTNWDQSIPMEATQMIDADVLRAYRWAYNGIFAGYRVVWIEELPNAGNPEGTYSEQWIGWKVGSTVDGMGFAMQNRRHIKIGN